MVVRRPLSSRLRPRARRPRRGARIWRLDDTDTAETTRADPLLRDQRRRRSSASTIISSNLASLTASAFEPMSTPAPSSAHTSTHMASSWPVWRSASKAQSLFRETSAEGPRPRDRTAPAPRGHRQEAHDVFALKRAPVPVRRQAVERVVHLGRRETRSLSATLCEHAAPPRTPPRRTRRCRKTGSAPSFRARSVARARARVWSPGRRPRVPPR